MMKTINILALVVLGSLGSGLVYSQETDPEWPCVQRWVPVISPATLWPIPIEESRQRQWRKHGPIRALSERLGDIKSYTDAERALVSEFVSTVPDKADDREQQLTLLAVGIVDVTNRVRRDYLRGIKRYTRQQIAMAEQIENTLNELSVLQDSPSNESVARQAELAETLAWHERIYDQRERSIRALCDRPVELEETLSDVLRDLAQYLP